LGVFAIITLMVGDVMAQTPPFVFTPTSQDKARIRAQSLEVDDQTKIATFRDAEFLQDDQLIRCSTLIIRYHPEQGTIQEVTCWPHEGRSR
jgi:lipopolysaccharide export system protein LptA